METDLSAVEIAQRLLPLVGEPDKGTRLYRAYAEVEDFERWFEVVCEICEPDGSVSPGGVSMYARVSRAGVHKRLREGRLTGFVFHKMRRTKILRRRTVEEGRAIILIPVAECRAWAALLKSRLSQDEAAREAYGDGDYVGRFLDEPPRTNKRRRIGN